MIRITRTCESPLETHDYAKESSPELHNKANKILTLSRAKKTHLRNPSKDFLLNLLPSLLFPGRVSPSPSSPPISPHAVHHPMHLFPPIQLCYRLPFLLETTNSSWQTTIPSHSTHFLHFPHPLSASPSSQFSTFFFSSLLTIDLTDRTKIHTNLKIPTVKQEKEIQTLKLHPPPSPSPLPDHLTSPHSTTSHHYFQNHNLNLLPYLIPISIHTIILTLTLTLPPSDSLDIPVSANTHQLTHSLTASSYLFYIHR
ncbi:hypothetical protein DL98DRAFT_42029 [Cadophora sp. DSE1049]|nr:hypothetical protein DL98DRAFT_42029 [Cadophora sp. DSE1049]